MRQLSIDIPAEVRKFAPKEKPHIDGDPMDESGEAIIAMLQKAADLSNENCDRVMSLAHKLSVQLRAAEDQINQLQDANSQLQGRTARAETWLALIQKEIEEKLIAPRASRPKPAI